jgi:hypothetical protein
MSRSRLRGSQGWSADVTARLVEPPLARRRRLREKKSKQGKRALEVDRSGSLVNLERAAKRLRLAHADERVLSVQHWNLEKAILAMRRAGVSGIVTNLCASEHRRVTKQRS